MDQFVVSARKYRPATFDMVVGQRSITNTLKNAIRTNHIAQAFLFCGPRGVGKTTCARILAKTINCENISENIEACNTCESCLSFNQSHSFNVHELDAASNNSVDGIRALVDQVRIPPQVGKYKVYIIDEVHMLSQQAFNAFLKTLEEPPAYAKFILATTEKHKIIPTILSRCQIFDFARITVDDITKQLVYVAEQESIEADPNALHIVSQKADGAMRDALSIFDQIVSITGNSISYAQVIENLNVLDYDYYFRMTELMLEEKASDILLLINDIIQKGFDGADFITGYGSHLRNLLVCKDPATHTLIEASADIREKYKEQSARCPEEFLLQALDMMNKTDIQYKGSNNRRLLLELALLQTGFLVKKKARPAAVSPPQQLPTPEKPAEKPASGQTVKDSVVAKTEDKPTPQPAAKDAAAKKPKALEKPAATEKPKVKDAAPEKPAPKDAAAEETAPQPAATDTLKAKPAPEPSKATRPSSPVSKISLKINGQDDKKQEPGKNKEITSLADAPKTAFTENELISTWNKLALSYKEESLGLFMAMTTQKPRLLNDFTIVVSLENAIQEDLVREKQSELLGQLHKTLNNYSIRILTKVSNKTSKQKAYLPKEKLQAIIKKNPEVSRLQKDLGMDLDY